MNKPRLLIAGTGSLARDLFDRLPESSLAEYQFAGFIEESRSREGQSHLFGREIYLDSEIVDCFGPETAILIGIADPKVRRCLSLKYRELGFGFFPNYIDSTVHLSSLASVGVGNIFLFNALISAETIVGSFNLFNWNVTVGDRCQVGSFCTLNPHSHVSGHVVLGDGSFVGAGATILEKVTVGELMIIGACALVREDILSSGTYAGIPARRLK